MKRFLALALLTILAVSIAIPSLAEGVTLKTVSIFAGSDAAAGEYEALLAAWQEKTGNKVEDFSDTSDETWKNNVLNDFAAGNEADVLFFFAKTSDSKPILEKVVPIEEINAAYPSLGLVVDNRLAEEDGNVYAIPVRAFWEALFVNVDLFEQYNVELPTDWAKLETAIAKFNEVGIVPISVSFSDVPHYVAEIAILACSTPEEHQARPETMEQVPASWVEGTNLVKRLYDIGAFPKDVNATTEMITSQMFIEKRAAMQLDGSWFANGIPEASWDTTKVIPFPTFTDDADPTAILGGISMGFYLSRQAWEDPARRDAAVDLLAYLTSYDNSMLLGGYKYGGELLKSSYQMLNAANVLISPTQDAMRPEVRLGNWFAQIPDLVEGKVDALAIWEEVMEAQPFAKAPEESAE